MEAFYASYNHFICRIKKNTAQTEELIKYTLGWFRFKFSYAYQHSAQREWI